MTTTPENQPFVVTTFAEDEDTGYRVIIAECIYATEALAEEYYAALKARVKEELTPVAAREVMSNTFKSPYTPVVPLTDFNPDRDLYNF
jgi:hypothetical protein